MSDDVTAIDALADFVNRFLRDRAAGRRSPLAHYLALYPGHEEAVAREYLGVVARLDAGAGPTRIGDYAVERELGRGGQAVVYLARDLRLPRPVALKVLADEGVTASADALARFGREAAVVSRLAHPGIATVYETGVVDGRPFLAMQYVDGAPLAAHVAAHASDGPGAVGLPNADGTSTVAAEPRVRTARALELIEAVAQALDAAHRAGVVHRDVKPSNILVRGDGAPVLVDFGLAWDEGAEAMGLTRSGAVFGTPAYMSPEQIRGQRGRPDPRTDVYSLGVTAYETLTGMRPFVAATREGLYRAILAGGAADPCRRNPALPEELRVVLATAMDVEPDRRYQSAGAFAEDLRRVRLRQPIVAQAPSLRLRVLRWTQRNPLAAASILALAVGLAVTVGVLLEMVALRASEQRALERVDVAVLADLRREAEERLWPETPAMAERLERWCQDAETLLAPRLQHWRGRTLGPGEHDVAADLAAFLGTDGALAAVRARRARIADVERRTSLDTAAWAATARSADASARYGGRVQLGAVYGLAPLGSNPRTGLLEFWHPRSGIAPERRGDGAWEVGAETAIVFVLLPGASYTMGARPGDAAAEKDESPACAVELAPFFVALHEVSQGQWARLTGERPSQFRAGSDLARRFPLDDRCPVETVSWEHAATWLGRFGLALPTEAQWEYACRAGTDTPWWCGDHDSDLVGRANLADKRLHDEWSDRPDSWLVDDGFVLHAPVGTLAPNPFGLHHVHGNVAEWCRDGVDSYTNPPRAGDGLRQPPDTGYRIVRGGHFEQVPAKARSSYRMQLPQDRGDYWVGIRPVLPLPAATGAGG